jgi:NADPH:quinone reductase-like Zn-dependent oxidoreductase
VRAVRLTEAGERKHPQFHDEPVPTPGRHDVLIRVHAASLNFRDQSILDGKYGGGIKTNGVPLSDGAGEVVAVGSDVTRAKVGDRVTANCAVHYIGGPNLLEYQSNSIGMTIDGILAEHASTITAEMGINRTLPE